jgi:E3 ubiquitin-protein ligase CCNP1IP1
MTAISSLQTVALTAECDAMHRTNEGLVQQYRDKNRQVLQLQEAYDKVKRKVEVSEIEKAAFDAVDSSVMHAAQQATTQTYETQNYALPPEQPGQQVLDSPSMMNPTQSRAPGLGHGFGNRRWVTQRIQPRRGRS